MRSSFGKRGRFEKKPKRGEGLTNRELELADIGPQVNKLNYDRKADRPDP